MRKITYCVQWYLTQHKFAHTVLYTEEEREEREVSDLKPSTGLVGWLGCTLLGRHLGANLVHRRDMRPAARVCSAGEGDATRGPTTGEYERVGPESTAMATASSPARAETLRERTAALMISSQVHFTTPTNQKVEPPVFTLHCSVFALHQVTSSRNHYHCWECIAATFGQRSGVLKSLHARHQLCKRYQL